MLAKSREAAYPNRCGGPAKCRGSQGAQDMATGFYAAVDGLACDIITHQNQLQLVTI